MTVCGQLIKKVLTPLAETILLPQGLTAAGSAAYAGIHKNFVVRGQLHIDFSHA